ncbi:MAG: S8 family serine peptidase [Candidatus Heimdallarchaeota archaeon]|nr:S8 family serine peptidase [Candidatus Heimdallarchaeota archaeon]
MKKLNSLLLFGMLFLMMIPAITTAELTFDIMRGGPPTGGTTPQPQVLDWGYERIGSAIGRAAATGMVQVAVLDTGIDYDHPDIAGVLAWCYDVIENIEGCVAANDEDGHGTHTAGTIGAIDNDIGIVGGAAGYVEIYALQVLGRRGGDWGDLATAIVMAANGPDGIEGNADDAEVISMSLGGDISSSPSTIAMLQDAIDYAYNAGTVLVASAGNEGDGSSTTTEPSWPAMNDNVIAVAASGIIDGSSFVTSMDLYVDDAIVSFSNSGDYVDITGPGVYITSLAPGGGTAVMSGTSMACPYVASVVALIMAANPGITPAQVENILFGNAMDIGYNVLSQGAGLVNAAAIY